MRLKTLLNRVHPINGFVSERVEWVADRSHPNGDHYPPRGAVASTGAPGTARTPASAPP